MSLKIAYTREANVLRAAIVEAYERDNSQISAMTYMSVNGAGPINVRTNALVSYAIARARQLHALYPGFDSAAFLDACSIEAGIYIPA